MNKVEELLSLVPLEVPPGLLILSIILSAIFSLLLASFYTYFGQSLSNRSRLAKNFVLVSVTTTLIITIVKSSLALSLGLVGALSIVRFRAAIKEPEELGYLFLAITLGLGFGANQITITIISFFIILIVLYLQQLFTLPLQKENLFFTLKLNKKDKKNLSAIIDHLSKNTKKLDLHRLEETSQELTLGCLIELNSPEELQHLTSSLRKKYPHAHLLLIDSSGIIK